MMNVFFGVVEDRSNDPFRLTRYRVRILGVHSPLKSELATEDLPWATPIQNNSAAVSGIGSSANGYLQGTTVACIFADEDKQAPLILGAVAGIPDRNVGDFDELQDSLAIIPPLEPPSLEVLLPTGETVPAESLDAIPPGAVVVELPYIGTLTDSQITKLKATIAFEESGNDYFAENTLGYLGKYQFGSQYLEDMGYITKGTYARIGNNLQVVSDSSNWTGKKGINSKEQFKQNLTVQEELMTALLKRNYTSLRKYEVVSSSTPPEKLAGALMAAHLKGAGGARDYIKNGVNGTDAYGTSCERYYQIGYALIAGQRTVEAPTTANINKQAIDLNEDQTNLSSKYDTTKASFGVEDVAFRDPDGVYPLEGHEDEPDTPRLASVQKVSQTIVGEKESDRTTNIPVANSSKVWSQSPVPYNSTYPYNHAYVSESGHVMEFDDTKGRERINIHHMAGTFVEVDSQGNQTNKVKGIRTVIVEKDELIHIVGSGHVSILGDMSVRVGGACNIEIVGDANMRFKGNLRQEVDGDMELKVGGSYTQDVGGSLKVKTGESLIESIGTNRDSNAGGGINLDGSTINLNSGTTSPSAVQSLSDKAEYDPVITIPSPVTRPEEVAIVLEEDPTTSSRIKSVGDGDKPRVVVASDNGTGSAPFVIAECEFGDLNYNTQLSKNYKLRDLIVGSWGGNFPFENGQNGMAAQEIACNLKQLAINVIEPLREVYSKDGFQINSCFRQTRDGKSFHEIGCAIDVGFMNIRGRSDAREEYYKRALEIRDLIPYDKIIMEYDGDHVWIHIQFKVDAIRRQTFTYDSGSKYSNGLVLLA